MDALRGKYHRTLVVVALEEVQVNGEGRGEHQQAKLLVRTAVCELHNKGVGVSEHLAAESAPTLGDARNLAALRVLGYECVWAEKTAGYPRNLTLVGVYKRELASKSKLAI